MMSCYEGLLEPYRVTGQPEHLFASRLDIPCATADGKTVLLRMCDYASAGHTWSEESALRVRLPQPLSLENPFAP